MMRIWNLKFLWTQCNLTKWIYFSKGFLKFTLQRVVWDNHSFSVICFALNNHIWLCDIVLTKQTQFSFNRLLDQTLKFPVCWKDFCNSFLFTTFEMPQLMLTRSGQIVRSKLYIISKCIEVYEESHSPVKRSLLILIKFWAMSQIRIV